MSRVPLSACVITLNEADRIDDCLASLAWCDEIVVIDSHSSDATRERAARRGARVIERDWPGHAAQKEFAVRAATHDWVLCIDADECVPDPLRAEIEGLRERGFGTAAGYSLPRRSWYLGRWIHHGTWYPDRSVRLFDRRRGRFVSNPSYELHEHVVLDGPRADLRGDLLHRPYRDLSEHLATIDAYTTIMARGLYEHGRRARASDLVLHPWGIFVKFYLLKRGFLDGWRGLLLAYLAAHYVRLKYAKLLVLTRQEEAPETGDGSRPRPPREDHGMGMK